MAEIEAMLAAREAAAGEIVAAAGRLGVALRAVAELAGDLCRAFRAAGISAEPFLTQPNFREACCSELTRAGLDLHRADPSGRLGALVETQHRRYRALVADQRRVRGPAAA